MKITKSLTPSSLSDWRNWLAKKHEREQKVWLSDAKKPETFERRFKMLMEEVMAGKPTAMH